MCPLLALVFKGFFFFFSFAVAINSTNEANKAGGTRLSAVYITQMSMNEALSPSKQLDGQQKSVANFVRQNLIVFKCSQTYIKNIRVPKLCLFFLQLQWLLSFGQFCDFSLNKSCKTYLGTMMPPGSRNWQLIPLIYSCSIISCFVLIQILNC